MSSQPIRIGFIGLSSTDSWAVNAHLPYLKDTSKYKIVALLNSSEDSARAAIKAHGLPAETKAYGSTADLAADEDIDLVVCSVRVDKHYPVLKPILETGKMKAVHCEWPLGKNLAEAEELAAIATSRGIRTIVGLQGRKAPVSIKAKEIIDSGKIGKVLSVTVTAVGYNFGEADLNTLSYLSDINFGGNMVTIHFSHSFDTITQAVGQLTSYSTILATQRPVTLLRNKPHTYKPTKPDDEPVQIVGSVPRTSHDQILLQGRLESGAVITFHQRGGQPFPGTPGIVWSIYGEKGELRITTPTVNLHFGGPGHELWHHDHATDTSEQFEIPQDEFDRKELPAPAKGPARIYEAFTDGKTDEYADWADAVKRHRLVEEMYQRSKEGVSEKPAQYNK